MHIARQSHSYNNTVARCVRFKSCVEKFSTPTLIFNKKLKCYVKNQCPVCKVSKPYAHVNCKWNYKHIDSSVFVIQQWMLNSCLQCVIENSSHIFIFTTALSNYRRALDDSITGIIMSRRYTLYSIK